MNENARRTVIGIVTLICVAAITIIGMMLYRPTKIPVRTKPELSAQKFRFGELCPDGLRVEYVNVFQLPKSVVCQKAVGE